MRHIQSILKLVCITSLVVFILFSFLLVGAITILNSVDYSGRFSVYINYMYLVFAIALFFVGLGALLSFFKSELFYIAPLGVLLSMILLFFLTPNGQYIGYYPDLISRPWFLADLDFLKLKVGLFIPIALISVGYIVSSVVFLIRKRKTAPEKNI